MVMLLYFWKIKCSKSQNCFEFVGFIRLDKLISANSFEISVFVANKFKKKGIATKFLALTCKNFSHLNLFAFIANENIASRKLFEKVGFHRQHDSECDTQSGWSWYIYMSET